ncbi:MAG TPA: rod shape-determining protein MreC [Geobacteraceae bacterium]
MWELIRKYRLAIGAGGLLLLVFIFYSLNLRHKENATPFERAIMNLVGPAGRGAARGSGFLARIWSDYLDLVDVRRENRQLRQTVKTVNSRLIESQEALVVNERLKRLLDLKTALRLPSLAATVIGEDGSPWFKTIVIDRGERDGLREGLPVVAVDGVVGQLVKVSAASSRVLLVTDTASSVAAVVQRSRARGVLKGKGEGRCSLEFAERDDDVKVGDLVISSGMGGVFPKGLPLGEVTMVKKGDYGIFQTVEVRPTVAVGRLEEVLVLVPSNQ